MHLPRMQLNFVNLFYLDEVKLWNPRCCHTAHTTMCLVPFINGQMQMRLKIAKSCVFAAKIRLLHFKTPQQQLCPWTPRPSTRSCPTCSPWFNPLVKILNTPLLSTFVQNFEISVKPMICSHTLHELARQLFLLVWHTTVFQAFSASTLTAWLNCCHRIDVTLCDRRISTWTLFTVRKNHCMRLDRMFSN